MPTPQDACVVTHVIVYIYHGLYYKPLARPGAVGCNELNGDFLSCASCPEIVFLSHLLLPCVSAGLFVSPAVALCVCRSSCLACYCPVCLQVFLSRLLLPCVSAVALCVCRSSWSDPAAVSGLLLLLLSLAYYYYYYCSGLWLTTAAAAVSGLLLLLLPLAYYYYCSCLWLTTAAVSGLLLLLQLSLAYYYYCSCLWLTAATVSGLLLLLLLSLAYYYYYCSCLWLTAATVSGLLLLLLLLSLAYYYYCSCLWLTTATTATTAAVAATSAVAAAAVAAAATSALSWWHRPPPPPPSMVGSGQFYGIVVPVRFVCHCTNASLALPKRTPLVRKVFEDAQEDSCPIDLKASMHTASLAVNLFFNNRFEEARAVLRPWAHKSMYHALGYGVFMFLQAIMTFDPKDIETASESLKQSLDVCNKYRRRAGIGESLGKMVKRPDYNTYTDGESVYRHAKMVKRPDYNTYTDGESVYRHAKMVKRPDCNTYTDEEMHAELCYAETLLLRAVLSFIEDETLISFVKGGIKIRACYQSYKECWYMLESRRWDGNDDKRHFESGVRMGVGSFNLLISQLPARVLKLLEFVGFSGNKYLGLSELQKGFELRGSLRRVLCALILLGSHLLFAYVLGTADGDIQLAQSILDDQLELYPNGALFLFFAGRLHYVKAEFAEAAVFYHKSWASQNQWRQFHHVCYWELMWCGIMTADWDQGIQYACLLLEENKWSKATYAYIKACCLCMKHDLSDQQIRDLRETMRSIPGLKQRIAGKSLPVEKFAVKKSQRFFAQKERLTLAALELIYAWNGFRILGGSYECVDRLYSVVEAERIRLENLPLSEQSECHMDDVLLAYFLKGCCLTQMKVPLQAAECFTHVISNEKKLKEDKYLVPSALLEVGLLHVYGEKGDLDQARTILEYAKNNYKGYSLESRLHFRIHGMLNKITAIQKGLETVTTTTPTQTAAYLARQKQQQQRQVNDASQSSSHRNGTSENVSQNNRENGCRRSQDLGSPNALDVPEGGASYPGISRSPSPFTPGDTLDDAARFEDLTPTSAALDFNGLCDLKIT
ncbi:Outer membrane protein Iml2/Tetratricopeptide repeat protein 39 [Trinorchestia longiramus]|nr:Outer membrane protein Iml2/Tetratricopeptide repeat protein 39 [Trinorchestia longiramus]